MATAVAHPAPPKPVVPGPRFDHFFFSGMALLMLVTVFVGFAPTYYLAGVFRAPLPSLIIHLHGAAFTCWILLLVTQTSLVAAGRVDLHRRLGVAGFFLACLMVALGVLAATDTLLRNGGPAGRDAQAFYIVPLTDMLVFSTLVFLAFRSRSKPTAHKRLIYVATTGLMIAAVARWPLAVIHHNPVGRASLLSCSFLLFLAVYDLWSTHKIHRVTLWGGAALLLVQQLRIPIGKTAAWHAFAAWVQSLAR
jgi:FtsH-binding integral membrane protein